ncbi:sigma-70 family RNA polymerase sigma factor [Clostridium guangxiense]|uniref:sigma-70 family RNA polymerase sigma factor n=1 Tax=Clostridium guangxiense TaxID=1662055 RepID=UPI001E4EA8FC|nr:sigma-70 family RNA polymerase sigma factor [Clostridium guangxiense]MCD2345617.1 sigma-70 family RNA polymerase sigma factor [Clostridium guangxiense]
MSDGFYRVVNDAQSNDKQAIMLIINKFKPLIKKYSYLLKYDDASSDLTISLIEIIKKIPVCTNANLKSDKFLVGYIASAIKNRYIYLSKKYYRVYLNETSLNLNNIKSSENIDLDDKIFVWELLDKLSKTQREVLILKFIKDYSDKDISKTLKISRQSVNRTKNRGLDNMRRYIGCKNISARRW